LRHSRAGQRVGTVSRWSLAEAGIALKLVSSELMSLLDAGRQGKFEAHLIGWSGRVDPDLNVTPLLSCKAAGNDGRYCNPALDELLAQAWATADVATRKALYAQVTANATASKSPAGFDRKYSAIVAHVSNATLDGLGDDVVVEHEARPERAPNARLGRHEQLAECLGCEGGAVRAQGAAQKRGPRFGRHSPRL
jgi:hypothetical protein